MLHSKKLLPVTIENSSAKLFVVNQDKKNFLQISYPSHKLRSNHSFEKKLAKEIIHLREEERLKLGQELHDSVNPLLSVVKIYLSFIDVSTEKNIDSKTQAASALLSAIENIRSISSALVVSKKTNYNLTLLINDLVENINHTGILKISFKLTSKKEIKNISPEIKIALYRIIQEQLNNTLKHSEAKNAKIRLSCTNGFIRLIIKDDGVGYDTAKQAKGIGLINITERVNLYNGKMQITSAPGKGCCLDIVLPAE